MPLATKKNLYLDRPSKSRGYMSGKDVTWTGEDVNTHIEKWMRDMGLLATETDIPKSGRLEECVVVGGNISGDIILAKNRDRKRSPVIQLVRKLSNAGVEMVLMIDKSTKYIEGMNEHGIGILNSTLLNRQDSDLKSSYNERQGSIIHQALCCKSLDEALGVVATHSGGLEGHTFLGDPTRIFHIELMSGQEAIVRQLDPTTGWDARTNHGVHYPQAGFMPRDGKSYMSSMYRQAMSEIELNIAEDEKDVMRIMRQQHHDPESHLNIHRRIGPESTEFQLKTTSQVVLNLSKLQFFFHCYSDHLDYQDIADYLPEDYDPKIEIKVTKSQE